MKKNEKVRIEFLATRGGKVQSLDPLLRPTSVVRQELSLHETGGRVKAVEKPSTIFTGWSDGVKANPRTYTVSKEDYETGGNQIIANFSCKYWIIGPFIDWIWSRRLPKKRV